MPLFRRFGRPGLLGSVEGSAVVAGTATMTSRVVSRGPLAKGLRNAAAKTDAALPAAPVESMPSQLGALSSLHASGAISDDEFAQAKKRVLGG